MAMDNGISHDDESLLLTEMEIKVEVNENGIPTPESFSTETAADNSSVLGKKRKLDEVISAVDRVLNLVERIIVPQMNDREEIFGKYVASELKVISEKPTLYIQTKQAILEALTTAHFEILNPE